MQRHLRKHQLFAILVSIAVAIPAAAQTDPGAVADAYVLSNAEAVGLSAADLSDRQVSNSYSNQLNGLTHVYYIQRHQGIEVFNAIYSLAVTPSGEVVLPVSRFVPKLASRINTTTPTLTSEAAVLAAASALGISASGPLAVESSTGGPSQEVVYTGEGISLSPVPARLVYFRTGNLVRLSWDLTIEQDTNRIWIMKIDAVTGEVLHRMNMVQNDSYRVYAWPAESPNHVSGLPAPPGDGRVLVSGSVADPLASPFGWHDTNGVAGADTLNTSGNNVIAQTDLPLIPGQTVTDNRFTPGVDVQPSSDTREFDYPADLMMNPETYREAVVTNLFYWNNIIHDITYKYGFDEPSGNFQLNNYGRGGVGNDRVIADAQDGSGTNNANFATPRDGSSPRMQMFIWIPSKGNEVVVNSPSGLGTYTASGATFGARLDSAGVTAEVALVDDGVGVTWDFCEPVEVGSLTGKIALAVRGSCNFTVKAQNADRSGAAGLIVVNNIGDNETLTMGSATPQTDSLILVPSQMIGRINGHQLKDNLPANVTMRFTGGDIPRRDSDFDNGVIIHEYTHGISNRLTGGPAQNTCLTTAQQAGEGWSDWFALSLTAQEHHTAATPRGIGTYVTFEDDPATARGIRPYPYTTDMNVNPQTYGDLTTGKLTVPHGVGSVWATVLWDMHWALVGGVAERGLPALGFRQDLYDTSSPLAGNQIALRLVMDGMKLQPCNPSFLEARDAILEADRINFNGAHACYIWWAFARRGMGVNADDGGGSLQVAEDFSTPQSCTTGQCLVSPKFSGAHSVVSSTDGSARLTVRWDAAVANCGDGTVSYSVYRSTESQFAPAAGNLIASGLTGTSYVDGSVSSGVRYFYVVRASDSAGNTDSNLKRRSGVPVGELSSGAVFFDDAGDTRPQQFVPNSAVLSWVTRPAGGVLNSRAYATSTVGNYPSLACMQLESDTIYLGSDPDLQFFTSYQIEPAWDGGIVEVATESGNFSDWTKLDTITYPGIIESDSGDPACSNPGFADGQRAFNGVQPVMAPYLGSLAAYADQAVRVRFVFTSDPAIELDGWMIDDISIDDVRASGPVACLEDDAGQIAYSGGWHQIQSAGASGGSFRMHSGNASSHNLKLEFMVSGGSGSLTYHYAKSAKGGAADVYVDGVFKGRIDYAGSAKKSREPEFGFSFGVEGLSEGPHTFELRNLSGAVYVDRFCVKNGSSSALPVEIPGVTTSLEGTIAAGQQVLQSVTVPAGATQLSVMAESTPDLPIQLVVLDPLGSIVGTADNTSGFAAVTAPVSASGVYVVKVVNASTGPVDVWTASTPMVRR